MNEQVLVLAFGLFIWGCGYRTALDNERRKCKAKVLNVVLASNHLVDAYREAYDKTIDTVAKPAV